MKTKTEIIQTTQRENIENSLISTSKTKKIFSEIAGKYDTFNAISSLGTYKIWLKALMEKINVSHEDVVLDVAGGTGEVSFALAKTKKPERIVCFDLVSDMLAVAKEQYENGKAKGVLIDFVLGDAQDMCFEDESFDVVTMAYGIRNMPKREEALSEIYRVLKSSGTFACLEFSTPTNKIWNQIYNVYLDNFIPIIGNKLTGLKEDFTYLGDSIKSFPTQREFAKMIQEAGFTRVSWRNYSGGIAAIHMAHKA